MTDPTFLPCSATPVPCLPAWTGVVAVVPSTEILSPAGNILFNFHVRVSKVYLNNISFLVFNIYAKLLWSARSSKGFAQLYFSPLILSGICRYKSSTIFFIDAFSIILVNLTGLGVFICLLYTSDAADE